MQTNNIKAFRRFMSRTLGALNRYEILTALKHIREWLELHSDPKLTDRVNAIEQTYGFMLRYLIDGGEDTDRERIYSDLCEDLYGIVRAIEYNENIKDNPELYYNTARTMRLRGKPLTQLIAKYDLLGSVLEIEGGSDEQAKARKERDAALRDIFDSVWTLPPSSQRDIDIVAAKAKQPDTDYALAAQIVTALTLGCLTTYDRAKLLALLDIDETASQRVGARTIVGIVLILYRHARRLQDDYTLRNRFEAWTDNLINYRRLRDVIINIIRTVGQDKIMERIQHDIMPGFMQQGPQLMEKMRDLADRDYMAIYDGNPEWEEMLEKSGLMDKIKTLESMQRDGADLMLLGVGRMKQMPFFNNVANWTLPFATDNSYVNDLAAGAESDLIDIIDKINIMCDSDKYSFCFMLAQIPEAQRRQMTEGLRMQQEQQSEDLKEKLLHSSSPEFDTEVLSYLRSLYRFYKYFRAAREFDNPLTFPFDFSTLPFVDSLLKEREILGMVAEYYMRNKYFDEAIIFFEQMTRDTNDGALYEKLGFCYFWTAQHKKALDYLEKAELLKGSSRWLDRHIAKSAFRAGDFEKSATYYAREFEQDSENLSLISDYAEALLEACKYDEALRLFYKGLYIDESDIKCNTLILECYLRSGRYEKAVENLSKKRDYCILNGHRMSKQELLYAGHALYGLRRTSEAIKRYIEAATIESPEEQEAKTLRELLTEQWQKLPRKDFDMKLIPLICDAVDKKA